MEVARLDILLRSTEAVQASGNLESALTKLSGTAKRTVGTLPGTFDKLKNSIFSVKGLVVGLIGGLGVDKLIQYSSAWEDISSRVRLAADESEKVSSVMERLGAIADRNYSSFESVAETYLRNATTLNALGIATQKQIDLTEAVANAMTISGAKGARADIVMQAFARSMANGALKGDDLNTIIQQGGRLAEALAVGLGKPVTALRAMGNEGQLTAKKMEEALGSQLEQLRKEADSMPATIGDAFTRMKNQIMATVGSLSKESGLNTAFVGIIDKVTVAIRDFTPVLLNLSRAITGTLDPTDQMSEEMKGAVTPFIVLFGVIEGGVKLIGAVFMPAWTMLKASIGSLVTVVVGMGTAWVDVMKGMHTAIIAFVKAAMTNFASLGKVIDGVLTLDFGKIKEGFSEAASATKDAFGVASASIKASMTSARVQADTVKEILQENGDEFFKAQAKMAVDGMNVITAQAEKTKNTLDQLWNEDARTTQDRSPVMGEGNILTPPPGGGGEIDKDAAKRAKELADALDQLRGQYDSVWAAQKDLTEGLKTLDEAEAKGLITKEERLKVEGQMRRALEDQLDPIKALNRDMDEQVTLLRMTADEREVEAQLIALKNQLTGEGLVLGEAELKQMRERLQAIQKENELSMERDRLMKDSAAGREKEDQTSKDAIKGLLGDKDSGYTASDAVTALQGIFGVSVDDMKTDAELRLEALQEYYEAVNELRDQDTAFAQAAAAAQEAIEVAKRDMFAASLDRMAAIQALGQTMMQSNNKKVFQAGKNLAIAGAIINGVSSAIKSFDNGGGYPWGLIPMALSIATTAAQIAQIRSTQMPGFRTGGEYKVGGMGGPDSQFIGMNVSPGERISINTPSQAVAAEKLVRMMEQQGPGGNTRTINQSVTVVQQGRADNKTPEQNARAMRRAAEKMGVTG